MAEDLDDQRLMNLVCAVGLLHLRVTAPYWELLQSKVKYTDFHKYVQPLSWHMDKWEEDASDLIDPSFEGVFAGEFELGGDKTALKESVLAFVAQHADEVKTALQQLMTEMLVVLLRQLGDFHQGGI